ncbi:MAG: acyl-CoA dehydrogenase [Betaproteobacteria bacterium]|nr:acyl-CoA dehydrogenase [Betaproteobacteria bacterium]
MLAFLIVCLLAALALAYLRASGWMWTVITAYGLYRFTVASGHAGWMLAIDAVFLIVAVILNLPPLRRALISDALLAWFRRILPAMSQTEREAIDAGTVWWEGELFSGRPDWRRLLDLPEPKLTAEEQAFLDNETEELCRISNDWETTHVHHDLPPRVWQFIKDKGFLGMIIPKQYGGRQFSAFMHSQVVTKLASRCSATCVSVMVPNSLGPAELLLHYGTEAQKNHYLPRLARGLEIPCFGLTNPSAGSDAAAIPDVGVVCKGLWEGREVLGMRVTWEKRYITLGPVSTLLGLAFRLRDPERLLGGEEDLGITCALVPTQTPGVNIGRRHNPLDAVFQNGPNWGTDVFMPLDWIIGGPAMAGQGWRMLMECLAAGRSISLPSSAVGYTELAARAVGAYARVRSQFKTPIGKFEGIEEAMTRIGGNLYLMDAARKMTAGAIDLGEKPSVVSAIVKYHLTERGRAVVNDAMDVLGGKGICLGPNNFMGRAYQQLPIAITVEGANILTRSLIIFGQGAIRCHPHVLAEMRATQETDHTRASVDFDAALWGHVRFALANKARAFVMGLTGSLFAGAPGDAAPELRRYYRQLTRCSAAFAFLSDASMLVLGGSLKRHEKLSARLGDVLSQMYLACCVLKRFEDDGRPQDDLPFVHWALQDALARIRAAFDGVFANYPGAFLGWGLRRVLFPLGMHFEPPSDALGHEITRVLIQPSAQRDRLTAGMYLSRAEGDALATLEAALDATLRSEAIEARIRAAQKSGRLTGLAGSALIEAAHSAGVISADDAAQLARTAQLRDEVVRVDHFPQDMGAAEAAAVRAQAQRPDTPQRAAA